MAVIVFDTSALSAHLRAEPGHELVGEVLQQARDSTRDTTVLLPFIVLMEIEYTSLRYAAAEAVENMLMTIASWPVRIIESYAGWGRMAAHVKHRYPLSLADAWVASLALLNGAELMHKDPEFDRVPGLKALRLPYDRDGRSGG